MKTIEGDWATLGGYEIVAGPIERPMGCIGYVVLNNDGCYQQLHVCKAFPDGRISKRGESQYDLVPAMMTCNAHGCTQKVSDYGEAYCYNHNIFPGKKND